MDLGLGGRHALVTGASKGIGYATAQALVGEGCRVTMVARTGSELEMAAKRIGPGASTFVADLSKGTEVDRLWAAVGHVDILVNNAGSIPPGSIEEISEARWREAWDLKVFGYINMCRCAMTEMKKHGSGVIINIIGAAGEKPTATYAAGSAGNAALIALTRALGSTSPSFGVRVVGVNPGPIQTERLVSLLQGLAKEKLDDPDRWHEFLDKNYPPGTPEQVAASVALLASDLSANTSGTVLTIDGGHTAR